jgi:hypothetical protein
MVADVLDNLEKHEHYLDIIYILKHLACPNHLFYHKRRSLRLKVTKYCIIQDGLGWRNHDGLLLRCVDDKEAKNLMENLHKGLCGGHRVALTTTHKILRLGYY